MSEPAMFRKLAELLLDIAGDGGMIPVPAPALAALCERWLAVEDAPVVEADYFIARQFDAMQVGQRVRIIPEGGSDGG